MSRSSPPRTPASSDPETVTPAATTQAPSAAPAPVVGIVGVGHMGSAFALNLSADGRQVLAYDRDPARLATLHSAGVKGVSVIAELAACDIVITSLPDDDTLRDITLRELVPVMRRGAVHVSTSTVSPELSRSLAGEHAAHGQHYVAAPVLGNPDLARSRRLFALVAGRAGGVEIARPLLQSLTERVFIVSDDPGASNLMKLAANTLTAITLQSMAEVLALLRKGGIDSRTAFEILTNSLFDSKVHRTYGGKIVDERYRPAGMVVPLAIKDLRLALAQAEQESVPMPVASVVHDRLISLVAHGWAELDWSALGLLEAHDAGLPTKTV